jgi:hypothetical protein
LPDNFTLTATVKNKQIYSIDLIGNRAAAQAFNDCTAFISAQKRPGTRNGPRLDMENGPPPPVRPSPENSSSDEPILTLPDAAQHIPSLPLSHQ